jgi:hypothetical protein
MKTWIRSGMKREWQETVISNTFQDIDLHPEQATWVRDFIRAN